MVNKEREFFGLILTQAVTDALSDKPIIMKNDLTNETYDARLEARGWLLTNFKESNYAEVCKGAGVDPDELRVKLKERLK